jgi:hypothetical protein
MSEKVRKLAPALDDPKVAEAAEEAIRQREEADYQCYMVLRDALGYGNIGQSLVERAEEACRARETANEEFLRLISGRKKPDGS